MSQEIINTLLESELQNFVNAPDSQKPVVIQRLLNNMGKLGLVAEGQDAAKTMLKLAPELGQFAAKKVAEASSTALNSETALLTSIMQADQEFVKKSLEGSVGFIGFAKGLTTVLQTVMGLIGMDPKALDGVHDMLDEMRDGFRADMQEAKGAVKIDIKSAVNQFETNFGKALDNALNQAPGTFNNMVQQYKQQLDVSGNVNGRQSTTSFSKQQAPTNGSPNEITMQEFTEVVAQANLNPALASGLMNTARLAASADSNNDSLSKGELTMLKNHASFGALSQAEQTAINPKLELALNN